MRIPLRLHDAHRRSGADRAGGIEILGTDHPTAPLSPCWLSGRRSFEAFGACGFYDADRNQRVDCFAGQGRLRFPLEIDNGLLRPGARYAPGADLVVVAELPPTGGAAPRATQFICGHFRVSGGGLEACAFSAGDFYQGAKGRLMTAVELTHPVVETLSLPLGAPGLVAGAVTVKLVSIAPETGLVCRTELRWTFRSPLVSA
jgi:hypothetical protein